MANNHDISHGQEATTSSPQPDSKHYKPKRYGTRYDLTKLDKEISAINALDRSADAQHPLSGTVLDINLAAGFRMKVHEGAHMPKAHLSYKIALFEDSCDPLLGITVNAQPRWIKTIDGRHHIGFEVSDPLTEEEEAILRSFLTSSEDAS